MAGSGKAHMRPDGDRILEVNDLTVEFNLGRGKVVKAVSGISLDLIRGETLAIVGESGCGKSTLGKAILQLPKPTSGSVNFLSKELTTMNKHDLREMRPAMQMIFQDPVSSLDPRLPVSEVLAEPLRVWKRGNQFEGSVTVVTFGEARVGYDMGMQTSGKGLKSLHAADVRTRYELSIFM